MKILLLGGTGYLGRHLAPRLLAAGHQVCSLQRGRMPTPALPGLTLLQGDRNLGAAGLQALAGQRFDVCVDFSAYTPAQVKASADVSASVESWNYEEALRRQAPPRRARRIFYWESSDRR